MMTLGSPPQPRAPPPPVPARDYLSFSAIRAYKACPLRYFFRYVVGLPEPTISASLVFGGAIHRAIEHHFRELLVGNDPPAVEALVAEYHREWQDRELDSIRLAKDDSRHALDALALRMLTAFSTSTLAQPVGRILAIEEELRGPVIPELPDILGRVDLIVETPEALVIKDWKTSRARWSAHQVDDAAEQLLLYAELARDFAPGKPLRLELAVFTKTKEVVVEQYSLTAVPEQIDRTKRVVERVWQAIDAGHFYPAPSLTACPGCPFRDPCRKWPG